MKTKERHKYVVSPMITQSDIDTVNSIKKKLELCADSECMGYDLMAELDTLDRLVENLRIAPLSYREAPKEDIKAGYFTALCADCGWWGSSKLLSGGDLIEDTGDYDDYRCPVCGSIEVYKK